MPLGEGTVIDACDNDEGFGAIDTVANPAVSGSIPIILRIMILAGTAP